MYIYSSDLNPLICPCFIDKVVHKEGEPKARNSCGSVFFKTLDLCYIWTKFNSHPCANYINKVHCFTA